MLHSYDDLKYYAIRAADDRMGRVEDFYFDDATWAIRYLVAHTGFLFSARESLIGVPLLGAPDTEKREFPVSMKAEEIDEAPTPDADEPVSAQRDRSVGRDFAVWPPFLIGMGAARFSPVIAEAQLMRYVPDNDETTAADEDGPGARGDTHLRSMHEVRGYSVVARDDAFGSVADFLVDPEGWTVRFIVIDTGVWLPGKRVVVTPDHLTGIDAEMGSIHVDVDKAKVESATPLSSVEDLKRSSYQEFAERYGSGGMWPVGL